MRAILNTRHPAHFWSGLAVLVGCICITALIATRRSETVEPLLAESLFQGTRGEKGQWTEILPRGVYTLNCESSEGNEKTVKLMGVTAKYIENPPSNATSQRTLTWYITAPTATHEAEYPVDILDGPLFIEVRDANGVLLGSGKSDHHGPALRRETDVWLGLAPLHWVQIDEMGRGEYFLPEGWRKESDDRFVVSQGLVEWKTSDVGFIRNLTAKGLNAKDITSGILDDVIATLGNDGNFGGGRIWAQQVEVAGPILNFVAPIRFQHDNGWQGTAMRGTAIRSETPNTQGVLDLESFDANGILGAELSSRNISQIVVHSAKADFAKWTASGISMEGNVLWDLEANEKNGVVKRYLLKAPKTMYRNAPGNIATGLIRSEGNPVLEWDNITLSSPEMTYQISQQTWNLKSPVSGTVPGGTFSAGSGSGSDSGWMFSGDIRADYRAWGTLRGNSLVWSENPNPSYVFSGNPAVLTGMGRRISGEKIIQSETQLEFPNGIQGSITFKGDTFTLRADRAIFQGKKNSNNAGPGISLTEITLSGGVECSAPSYRLSSKTASLKFDNDRMVLITATGGIIFDGSLGSGVGDTLELIFDDDSKPPQIKFSGSVQGKIDVPIGRKGTNDQGARDK
ncbi:MAG: hypothetical protein FWG02_01115 [Holophagaceae bacterium]|nr:hypothetical protein [Holophagaceae bacterium]